VVGVPPGPPGFAGALAPGLPVAEAAPHEPARDEPVRPAARVAGRHRAPPNGFRAAGAARRAGAAIRERAREGVAFVRAHLEADDGEPATDETAFPVVPEPEAVVVEPRQTPPAEPTGGPPEDPMEAFILERVAVGASMTSLTYRPYGQLRFLPPPLPP